MIEPPQSTTLGWRPTCEHYPLVEKWRIDPPISYQEIVGEREYNNIVLQNHNIRRVLLAYWRKMETVPATVLDPFAGSGTTLQVARALGRNGIGLDLSLDYLHLARERLELDKMDKWTNGYYVDNLVNCKKCEGTGVVVVYDNDGEPIDEKSCDDCNGKSYLIKANTGLEELPLFSAE